jgi:hypothetical protein
VKKLALGWLCAAALGGCAGQLEGDALLLLDDDEQDAAADRLAGAAHMLQRGDDPDEVAEAYPTLRIERNAPVRTLKYIDPDAAGNDNPGPEEPGFESISTPVESQPESEGPLLPEPDVDPTINPVEPTPETEGPLLPESDVDPTMDPVEPEPETEGPLLPEPGDDAISMTCRQECVNETTTECSTVTDPVLGTGVNVKVCHEQVRTRCHSVCTDDPPNA